MVSALHDTVRHKELVTRKVEQRKAIDPDMFPI